MEKFLIQTWFQKLRRYDFKSEKEAEYLSWCQHDIECKRVWCKIIILKHTSVKNLRKLFQYKKYYFLTV